MCGLCGILGGEAHWTDASSAANAADAIGSDTVARMRRRERQERVAYLNPLLRLFGCRVGDWQGKAYLLSTLTGKTEIVDNLTALWAAVERLTGRKPDPFALATIAHMRSLH